MHANAECLGAELRLLKLLFNDAPDWQSICIVLPEGRGLSSLSSLCEMPHAGPHTEAWCGGQAQAKEARVRQSSMWRARAGSDARVCGVYGVYGVYGVSVCVCVYGVCVCVCQAPSKSADTNLGRRRRG